MDEKDFLEFLIAERMGMHHDNFHKEYPPTAEEAAEKVDITAYIWYNVIIQYRR